MRKEVEDLMISVAVLVLLFSNFQLTLIPFTVPAVVTAFLVHELAHRSVARKLGFLAFYRRWDMGIVLALLLGIATKALTESAWIFAALGSVQVYSSPSYLPSKDTNPMGKIALAGPVANVVTAAVAYPLINVFSWAPLVVGVNLWIAFFNLLPVPPLDGWKVLRWSTPYWAISIGLTYAFLQVWG